MDGFSFDLLLAAAGIAFLHTILGPDHYLPFLMLARARRWSTSRTLDIAIACGLGRAVARMEHTEGTRGVWAAWGLVVFGAAYALWGTRRALRRGRDIEP